MNRRHAATSALSAAAASLILPAAARAQSMHHEKNVVFTADDPGHWAGVEALHIPVTTVTNGVLTVKTPHPMTAPHFIVSHTVVLAGGKFLDRKTFTYTDQPISTHTLPAGYTGKVIVTSTCNLHDFWVKTISV
jgi:superoxide reductase